MAETGMLFAQNTLLTKDLLKSYEGPTAFLAASSLLAPGAAASLERSERV
ncbi:hypothetical protein HDC90_000654 [Pedobacter sp. AK013]|nr:hypothetical protein [Pedobacter sp. AK013]MBB6236048.1 hypothetical protein [Pedobacter sp. AK013]